MSLVIQNAKLKAGGYGHYWVKVEEEGWTVGWFYESWGIEGVWVCGEGRVFYDEDILEVGAKVERLGLFRRAVRWVRRILKRQGA